MAKFILGWAMLILASLSQNAQASKWTDSEIQAMPPYCAARLKKDPAEYRRWQGILGPDFLHTHHFCYALGFINRHYVARTRLAKATTLNDAMGNLNYMISHASPTYSLMPEVYLNRGLVYSLMKKDAEAINDILKAVELDPRLARGYTLAAEHYTRLKLNDKALAIVTEGLRQIPDNPGLRRLYGKLGGQLPYPEPAARKAEAAALPPSGASPTEASPTETTAGAGRDTAVPQETAPAAEAGAQVKEGAAITAPTSPEIGTARNPWCRFCPAPAK